MQRGDKKVSIKRTSKKHYLSKILWVLIILGFAAMEFPGVFFFNRIEPMIFGLPFIYGFTILMWIYMMVILYIAYKTNWGKEKAIKKD